MTKAKQTPDPMPDLPPTPRRRRNLLGIPLLILLALQTAFRLIPEFRPGIWGVVCWLFGSELVPLAAQGLLGLALLAAAFRRPFWTKRRLAYWGLLVALSFSGALFGRYPSSFDNRPSLVPFRVPLDGPVTVAWGGGTAGVNYHVLAPDQRWAYDLVVTREGKTHRGDGNALEDYYIYDMPILAPCDAKVLATHDGDPDVPVGELGGGSSPAGNHVVLNPSKGEYLWLCHMKPGSVLVEPGDRVKRGEPVGRVGNSGNTSEPHLHAHLQSTPEGGFGEGIPMPFHRFRAADGTLVARGMPEGGISDDGTFTGQVIENVPDEPPGD